jgi:hypothetical protein
MNERDERAQRYFDLLQQSNPTPQSDAAALVVEPGLILCFAVEVM